MCANNFFNIKKFQTDTPKITDDIFIWADYFELTAFLDPNEPLSNEDLYKYIFEGLDFKPNDFGEVRPERIDKLKSVVREGLDNVKQRQWMLKDKYPFEYDDRRLELKLKEKLSKVHYTYLILLFASNLKYVAKMTSFTSSFEKISLDTLKVLFPNAVLKLFGSSNVEKSIRDDDKYLDAKLKDRIKHFANDIYHRTEPEVESMSDHNLGDEGIDIAGFIDMKDKRGSYPLLLAQCACSKEEWTTKQYSTHRARLSAWININHTSICNFIMVPFPFIDNNGEWLRKTDIQQNVLIDRIRIMFSLAEDRCTELETFALLRN